MEELIIKYISKYIPLSDNEVKIITKQNLIRCYKKNEVLLAEGEYATECYLVLSGCIRAYYLIDGEERNADFYTENNTITSISYQTHLPSQYYLSCIEDSIIAVGCDSRNKKLIELIPKLSFLIMQMNQERLIQKTVEFDSFKNHNPEQRYLELIEKKPDLANRIPLYHLASYLGITQVSLSRIRKRIFSQR
jgi:CRP-like cAMP-binding protein